MRRASNHLAQGCLLGALIAVGVLHPPTPATAGVLPACDALPNPVYMQIGDTQQPLIKQLGRALRDNTSQPISLVYITAGSCTNIAAIVDNVKTATNWNYVPSTAENAGWTPTSAALPCTPPAGGGAVPDIANSNVFVSACTSDALPASIATFLGPVQAYVMAVPIASSQVAITAEEAYFVFGFGAAGLVLPWIDEALYAIRTATKSTLLAWAYNISVPADKWKGVRWDKSTEVVTALTTASDPQAAIGLLGAEIYDLQRNVLKSLAFAAFGQKKAFWPDSTPTSFDKKNVRDGHYTVWSPTVYLTKATGGVPDNAAAAYVIDLILGKTTTPTPNFDPIEVVVDNGLVPDCAMGVKRAYEGGPLSLYAPAEPCGCRYESLVSTTSCIACDEPSDCGATEQCRHGFCEANE